MTTRYKDGTVTVTLDDGMERFVRGLLSRAETETVRRLEAEMEPIAATARAAWYGPRGVTRETGKSGAIDVVTTIDATRGEVRVSIGSTDDRVVNGKPMPVYVHTPGLLATEARTVSHKEYFDTPKVRRRKYPKIVDLVNHPDPNRFLLVDLVRKPVRARVKAISPEIGRAIAARTR